MRRGRTIKKGQEREEYGTLIKIIEQENGESGRNIGMEEINEYI